MVLRKPPKDPAPPWLPGIERQSCGFSRFCRHPGKTLGPLQRLVASWGTTEKLPCWLSAEGAALGGFPGHAGRWAAQSLAFWGLFPWFSPHFPWGYLNKTCFIEGSVAWGVPRRHIRDAVVGCYRCRLVSGEKSWAKFRGTGAAFIWDRNTWTTDSQDLLEERAAVHFPSSAGTAAQGKSTECPPLKHACITFSLFIFSSNVVVVGSDWKPDRYLVS